MTRKQIAQEEDELAQYSHYLRTYKRSVGKQANARWHLLCALWRRDGGTRYGHERFARCKYCQIVYKLIEMTVDHVVPKSRGGKSEISNYAIACEPCNRAKANLLIGEWDYSRTKTVKLSDCHEPK